MQTIEEATSDCFNIVWLVVLGTNLANSCVDMNFDLSGISDLATEDSEDYIECHHTESASSSSSTDLPVE